MTSDLEKRVREKFDAADATTIIGNYGLHFAGFSRLSLRAFDQNCRHVLEASRPAPVPPEGGSADTEYPDLRNKRVRIIGYQAEEAEGGEPCRWDHIIEDDDLEDPTVADVEVSKKAIAERWLGTAESIMADDSPTEGDIYIVAFDNKLHGSFHASELEIV